MPQEQIKQMAEKPEEEQLKTRTLADLSLVELKAMAYDQLALIEQSQKNLNLINQEIAKRGRN